MFIVSVKVQYSLYICNIGHSESKNQTPHPHFELRNYVFFKGLKVVVIQVRLENFLNSQRSMYLFYSIYENITNIGNLVI